MPAKAPRARTSQLRSSPILVGEDAIARRAGVAVSSDIAELSSAGTILLGDAAIALRAGAEVSSDITDLSSAGTIPLGDGAIVHGDGAGAVRHKRKRRGKRRASFG
jgi:hypothetical protein